MEHDQRPNQYISAKEFGMRFQSKKECYRFLTVEGGAYLPPHQVITLYFMRDLISGKKKFIHGNQVKHCTVPYYENISIEAMLEFASGFQDAVQYLPEYKECLKLPRQFIVNVFFTVIQQPFSQFIQERIEQRNKKLMEDHNQIIEISPFLKEKFDNCSYLSNQKGIGNGMLKINVQRRRTKQEIQADKNQAIIKQQEIEQKMAELSQLQQTVAQMEQQVNKGQEAIQFIESLVNKGIVHKDQEGNINAYEV